MDVLLWLLSAGSGASVNAWGFMNGGPNAEPHMLPPLLYSDKALIFLGNPMSRKFMGWFARVGFKASVPSLEVEI